MRANKRLTALLGLGMGLLIIIFAPVTRAQEPSATPDSEGNIYVTVLSNDSLWAIASRSGIGLEELLALNQLNEDAIIHPGQQLIVGQGQPPVTATAMPPTATATVTRPPPTPTNTPLPPPRTAICIVAFEDLNRDGVHDAGESLRRAVAFTIFNDVSVVDNYITDGVTEPFCLEGMAPGDYKVTRSIGRDETVTTPGDWSLSLTGGSVLQLEFGSYTGSGGRVATIAAPVVNVDATAVATENSRAPSGGESESGALPIEILIGLAALLVLFMGGGILLVTRARHSRPEQ